MESGQLYDKAKSVIGSGLVKRSLLQFVALRAIIFFRDPFSLTGLRVGGSIRPLGRIPVSSGH